MSHRRGITLVEVTIALVTVGLGFTALLRIWIALSDQVGAGRRWTAMTAASARELERLERAYRALAPGCVLPASGSSYTPDGVGLAWATVDSAGQLLIRLEARAAAGRQTLVDSVISLVPCR
jgi:hypothetical protein